MEKWAPILRVVIRLACKYPNRLDRLDSDKCTSLFRLFVNDKDEIVVNIDI
jgi:hypothetical protein